jgi:hypothetical protein
MSEKPIQERGKETLKWIQKEQKTSGLGMVESANVPDQNALRYLLRAGDVYEPQQGMIKSSAEPENEADASTSSASEFPDHKPWIWKTPKPKNKNDKPEPYEFLSYPDWGVLPNAVAEALRPMGFADAPYLYEGYSYRKMAGGALRRKMLGTHSKEALLAELKQKEDKSEEEWTKFKEDIDDKTAECKGKFKQFPEVQICPGIMYYPKDGSFSFGEKEAR